MMLACLGQVASENSPDADCFGARVHLMLMIMAALVHLCEKVLGHLPSGNPPDADDAGCFGVLVQQAAQLMLMMAAVLHLCDSPADVDDAKREST